MNKEYTVHENVIWVFDCETDNYNDENRAFSATPFSWKNDIVNIGFNFMVVNDNGDVTHDLGHYNEITGEDTITKHPAQVPWLLCGHNVKFDYHYWRKNSPDSVVVQAIDNGDTLLWDTQFAHYLLSGHRDKMISLDDLAGRYGVGEKTDDVKELWNAGYHTRDVDPEILDEYVIHDVHLTSHIALRQLGEAFEKDMLNFMLVQMRSLSVVADYEFNGMYIDQEKLYKIKEQAKVKEAEARCEIEGSISTYMIGQGLLDKLDREIGIPRTDLQQCLCEWIDVDSVDKLNRVIFGGSINLTIQVPNGEYKSGKKKGQTKYSRVNKEFYMDALYNPGRLPFTSLTPTGAEKFNRTGMVTFKDVSLNDKTINYILNDGLAALGTLDNILEWLKIYRDNNKLRSTYCEAINNYLFDDTWLHGNLNVDNTATGRLSSSNPNLQNMPSKDDSELKSVFKSRFDGGKIITADFKQLEVIALAYLSGDKQLIEDIENKIDIHDMIAKEAGITIGGSSDARRIVKGVVFGTIYGAGATKLAEQSGISKTLVKACIDVLKNRYPQAFGTEFVDSRQRELDHYAQRLGRTEIGSRIYGNFLTQPTGRKLWIETKDSRYSSMQQWPYTQLRNYPVQSFAADIVSMARILMKEEIRNCGLTDEILMINEVHDEMVFDVHRDHVDNTERIIKTVEAKLPQHLTRRYQLPYDFDLPLKLEIGSGDNWKIAK